MVQKRQSRSAVLPEYPLSEEQVTVVSRFYDSIKELTSIHVVRTAVRARTDPVSHDRQPGARGRVEEQVE